MRDCALSDCGVRALADGLPVLQSLNLEHCSKARRPAVAPASHRDRDTRDGLTEHQLLQRSPNAGHGLWMHQTSVCNITSALRACTGTRNATQLAHITEARR